MEKIAIVIFVKTLGISSCKTRLAADIGNELSDQFYEKSIKVTQDILQEVQMKDLYIDPYFAVAEKEGMGSLYWKAFHRIYQGEGNLGDRLSKVYDELIQKYDGVIFLGADCPHLKLEILHKALDHFITGKEAFILGKSSDGGFYLFGGKLRLLSNTWTSLEYSQSDTADNLKKSLNKIGYVKFLEESFDIDSYSDLENYEYLDRKKLSNNQCELIDWVQKEILKINKE